MRQLASKLAVIIHFYCYNIAVLWYGTTAGVGEGVARWFHHTTRLMLYLKAVLQALINILVF